jgi:subtilisin-like proprotein convertase family protein
MKKLYTNTKTWRATVLTVCSAFLLLCYTTAFAQTTFGPFDAGIVTPLEIAEPTYSVVYNGSPSTMLQSDVAVTGVTGTSVVGISVDVTITHTWIGDLTLKLVSPDGDTLTLMSQAGTAETADAGSCSGTSSDWTGETVTFVDGGATDAEVMVGPPSGTYFPSPGITSYPTQDFASLFGGTMNGTWSLFVGDGCSGDDGTLDQWSITIVTASPSFTLTKTVGLEPDPSGLGCTALPVPTTQSIGVNVGDSVCYWYIVENTGDVELDVFDFVDDQLLPSGLVGAPQTLGIASTIAIPWDDLPTEITAEVTNIADITFYDTETGLSAGPETDQATVGIIPANDECVDAIPLSCGVPVVGTTEFSTDAGNPAGCAQFADDPVVWYSFVGTGYPVRLTTCGTTTDGASEAAYIGVYEGTCGALVCESGGSANQGLDPNCAFNNSQLVNVETTLGTTYYVTVTAGSGAPNVIDFDLTLDCAPANDLCENAEVITCGQTVTGFTEYGTADAAGTCVTTNTAPGVWYEFVGDGSAVTASLCTNTSYDTKLSVYTGSCGTFTCVTGNDDACGVQSEVTFTAASGTPYFILVHGFGSGVGAFELSLTCVPPPPGDVCSDAIEIACGDVVSGDFSAAGVTADNTNSSCSNSVGPGLWYHFVGTGEEITATTCGSNADTEMTVYSGDCNALVCVGSNDDDCGLQSTVDFFGVFGEDYYVNVAYWSSSSTPTVGDFDLSISCVCTAEAGTITADASPVCMSGGSATISATHDGNATVPTGYIQLYLLADAATGIILDAGPVASFTVAAAGDYVITTAIYDPLQLDPGTLPPGTTVAEVFVLTIDGGGTMCGSVDMVGTTITVNEEPTAVISGGGPSCDGANVDVQIDFTGTGPWDVSYTDPVGVVALSGVVDNPLVIATNAAGGYSLNSVSDANCPGVVSGSATVTSEVSPVADFSSAQTGGTLDVDFTDASTTSSTIVEWAWDFGDGNTSSDPNPTNTYALDGPYTVCLTVTDENGCASESCEAIQVTDIPTTIAEAVEQGMEVYPNPSNGQFVVVIEGVEADVQIIVMDLAGRQVYNEGATLNNSFRKELNLDVAKGTYLLQIGTVEGVVTRKIQIH